MATSDEAERIQFVGEMISDLIKAGCDHSEVCDSVGMLADVLETVAAAGVDPSEFLQLGRDKTAFVSAAAQGIPWETLGNVLGGVGNTVLNAGTNTAGRLAGVLAENAIPAAVLAPLAAGAVGYGAGQMAGNATDDADERISDIRHQELLSALRSSTEQIKRRKHLEQR